MYLCVEVLVENRKKALFIQYFIFFHIREVMVLYVQWQRITREYYCLVTGSYEHSLTIIWSRKYV